MRRRRTSSRCGFTLIELVASAVLAAMMMAALLNVLWSTVRESKQLRLSEVSRFPITRLVDQMRFDLQNSRGMAIDSSGLTLHGFLARDPRTNQPLLTPGRVRYQIRNLRGRGVLMRTSTGQPAEPAWLGVTGLNVTALAEADAEDETLPAAETGGLPEVPLAFRVTMVGTGGRVLWQEVIHHHDE